MRQALQAGWMGYIGLPMRPLRQLGLPPVLRVECGRGPPWLVTYCRRPSMAVSSSTALRTVVPFDE